MRKHRREETLFIYNSLKIDKTNHMRERDKGNSTRARRMCQSNRRPSRREREESRYGTRGEGQFISSKGASKRKT